MTRSPDLLQFSQESSDLIARADGDAHAAGDFVAAVADQHAAAAQLIAQWNGARASFEQDKIGAAVVIRDAEFFEADIHQLAGGQNFGDVLFDVLTILNRGPSG